jgi:tetratricopeptide (TPR) repeat protein
VVPFFSFSGRRSELELAYAQTLRIQEQLVREFPANLDYQHDLGLTYFLLGYMHLFGGGLPVEAEAPVRQAVAIREKLVEARPSEFNYRQELGDSLGNLADLLMMTGRYHEAQEVVHRDLKVRQQLVDDFPAEPSARQYLAAAYMDGAELRHRTHQWHEAVEARRQELRLRKQVLAEFPSMMPYLPDLARCSVRLGDALRRIGAEDEAIAAYQEAISACKEANRRQPKNIGTYVWWGLALARTDAGAQAVSVCCDVKPPNRATNRRSTASNAASAIGRPALSVSGR